MGGVASMPGRGRKPKPTAKKKLAGNPGKRALNKNEPVFASVENIDVPDWIAEFDLAAGMWETIAPQLCKERVLSITDIHNLEIFCMAYQRWREAQKDVAALGGVVLVTETGSYVKNPAMTAINESARQMATFGSLLGLDPASRSRLMGGNGENKGNPFLELLGG